ncbi:DUF6268 family outer membrane beta-barrel protein [Olivibacter jilunii]|uniref:DUF6268 family outer membrane beta-barrel protein n=1 Tax=Olivibacter jilunii TaxID=985016 RepID=UPI00102F427A|nr:DUF6268 family outer membrane beta-barrel protein [Olivibacter jilunii]
MILITSSDLMAQDLKLAGVEYFSYPKAGIKDADGNTKIGFREFGAYVNFPKVLKNNKTIIVNGLSYGFVEANLFDADSGNDFERDFHRISYNFIAIHQLQNNWTLTARLSPTLASDFKESLSWDDYIMQGSLMAVKRLNPYTSIGGGFVYTTNLGTPLPLPGFQMRYEKGRQHLLIFLPAVIDYGYQLDAANKWKIGLRTGLNGANFNVSTSDNYIGSEPDRLKYFRANVGPVVNYKITNVIQLEAFGGLSAMRKYRFEDHQGNESKYDSERSSFINIGIAIVPSRK